MASFVCWRKAREHALPDEKVIDIFILSLSTLIIGGRLIHAVGNFQFFASDLGRLFLFLKYPGLSFIGGIALAGLTVLLLSKSNGLNGWLMLDIFAITLASALVFGFSGCYLSGCMGTGSENLSLFMTGFFLILTILLNFLSNSAKTTTNFSKMVKKGGLVLLSYLIFSSISFLILSYVRFKRLDLTHLTVLISSVIVTSVRFGEAIMMVKFPSSVLTQIKSYLEKRRLDIEKKLSELKREDPFEDRTRLLDRASEDSEAQSKAGHERVTALTHQMNMALVQTRKALTKIKVGNYGICENCGRMIDTDRLAAMPTATLCVNCERKKER